VTTHLESNAITGYSGLNFIAARVRAMEPRGEAREEAEPVLELLEAWVTNTACRSRPTSNYWPTGCSRAA
jgi:hypothetical protein